ncbi:hypothetical protein K493DRAFT_334519 [Basidiobolus meristosporus CBS 931.73]|uniref:Uncharacterized protein n=1 Tax=Basidiobolus meristosporus CBS 931.73 TaxID=1314790 RepID=A0A1Y1YXD8_9FUNG|nr:hypothetical protein K493DRAFT_334519 [Basidiobolus meristosporus CBS 931.73]|eukprot:ORY02702.1 hypothetical protein K493DRAFT_334519 [Basidiobolus meristosporus CBS 931.73]
MLNLIHGARSFLILVSVLHVFSVPLIPINEKNSSGNICPLGTRKHAMCPILCVTDINQCPQSIRPTCPEGQSYCQDGSCKSSCSGAVSKCVCPGIQLSQQYYPCKNGQWVDIPQFDPRRVGAQTGEACASNLGLSNIPLVSQGITGSQIWLTCPKSTQVQQFTYTEPMWIGVWTILSIEVFLLVTWHLYKTFAERFIRRETIIRQKEAEKNNRIVEKEEHGEKAKKEQVEVDEEQDSDFIIKGYNNNLYGTIAFWSVVLMVIGWFVWLGVLTGDYYGTITGAPFGLTKLDGTLSSVVFVSVWYFAAAWLLGVNILRARIRNYFRIQGRPNKSNYIQFERQLKTNLLLDDKSRLLSVVRGLENKLKHLFGWDYHVTTCPVQNTTLGRRYFEFQCTRYVFDDEIQDYKPFQIEVGRNNHDLIQESHGLTQEEAIRRKELVGSNFISVKVPSFPVALLQEFTSFFYLYQFMILWLFYYYNYYYIGLVDTGVILISSLIRVFTRLTSEHRVKKMAEHRSDCLVLRDGKWTELSTAELVPGDVFEVTRDMAVPCDGAVISGNIVADESSLTGEPLPIRKFPLNDDNIEYDPAGSGKNNTLYAGTTISQAAPVGQESQQKATALVLRTNTSTDKGKLVRKILFPNPIVFVFDEQLRVVMCVLLLYGLICFGVALWLGGRGDIAAWFYGMFTISQIISPLLPAALVVGQSVAANRLRKLKIFCVDLPRIIIAGKIRIFCFDKTGTLTKEGLEFYGVQPINTYNDDYPSKAQERATPEFTERRDVFSDIPRIIRLGVATCHTVTKVKDQLIGNPVDIEMFRATKWQLAPHADGNYLDTLTPTEEPNNPPIHVVKRYEFVHARASMSVAILDTMTGHVHVYVKGSFEKVKDLCDPALIPLEYDDMCNKLAMEGCYVLAMAHRDLGKIDPRSIQEWSREEMESQLNLMGLVLFKNMLKDDTTDAITQLKEGGTRTVMVTGDTALTGIYIARQCGMIPANNRVLLGDVSKAGLVWTDVDTGEATSIELAEENRHEQPLELAVTNKAFNHMVEDDSIRKYLLDIRVFARMKPNDKVECVQLHMERGVTAMCGDGGNDCGALRASHVGLALSEAEASIVSPFSSSTRSIMSCVELLKQGRAALATSFAGYKYLIMYGQTMAWVKIFTFYYSMQPSQNVWILIDAFVTVGLAWAVTQSWAAPRLAVTRPTARILGPETLASVLGQIVINHLFFIGAFIFLRQQPWYRCNEFDSSIVDYSKWWLLGDNYESETASFVSLYQFVNAAMVFNFGHKYRAVWWKNWRLLILWVGFLVIVMYSELADPNRLGCLLRLNCGTAEVLEELGYGYPSWYIEPYSLPQGHNVYPTDFRWKLWGLSIANMIAGILWQVVVVLGPVREYVRRKYPQKRLALKL